MNGANNVANDVENIHKMQCTQMTNELRNRPMSGSKQYYAVCMHARCTNSRNEREANGAEKHKTPNYANESNEDGDR